MKVKEIIGLIEDKAPKSIAYQWDNVGLLIGDKEKDADKVYVTLDINLDTVREAVKAGADMIVSHHPLFLSPVKAIDYSTPFGEMIRLIIQNDIAVYAAHTNMDTAKDGINAVLAKMFGLKNAQIIEYHTDDTSVGLGRMGDLEKPMQLGEFIGVVKDVLKTPVRYCGDEEKTVSRVAVGSGACGDLCDTVIGQGCDVFITADMKYHIMMDAYEKGLCVIDAGHYPTEICVMDVFADLLKGADVEIIRSTNTDVFKFAQ